MKIIVLKFGGTSVGSIDRIKRVAKIIKSYSKKYKVIVLSSAMSGTTNKLINMSKKISKSFPDHEYDTLVSAGEQISCSLLSGQLWISQTYPCLITYLKLSINAEPHAALPLCGSF